MEPVEISILFNNNNRPSGEANVEFANKEDAMRAMSKVKLYLSKIYIKIFLNIKICIIKIYRIKHICNIDI